MKQKIEKSNVQEIFELSMVQKGMLFHYLKESDQNLYNVRLSLTITGALEPDTLQKAFALVQANHEVLRSVFNWEDTGKPLQIILRECSVPFACHDVSGSSPAEASAFVAAHLAREEAGRFDLTALPLRVSLVKTADRSYLFTISHHHILYDGWSTGILLKELFDCYHRLSHNQPLAFGGIPAYKEVQRGRQKTNLATPAAAYWQGYLKGHEATAFFGNNPSALPSKPLEKHSVALPGTELEEFAARHRVTKAAVIYAAYGMLLQQYGNAADVVFGTTVSDRDASVRGADGVIGNFINTLPLRLTAPGEASLLEVVNHVNQDLIRRNGYHGTSYFEIKQWLEVKPTDDLFDSVVVVENYPFDPHALNRGNDFRAELESVYENTGIPLLITVFFRERIEIELVYQAGRIGDPAALGGHLARAIEEILNRPHAPVKSLCLLSTAEKQQVLYGFNDTAADFPAAETVRSLFEKQAEQTPENLALTGDGPPVTYRELDQLADRIAAYLQRVAGVRSGDLVGILLSRERYLVPVILGVMKAGGAYVPIDPNYPVGRVKAIMEQSGLKVLVTRGGLLPAGAATQVVDLDHALAGILAGPAERPGGRTSGPDLAYVIYTSGSTGTPKGVMITHRSLVHYISWAAGCYVRGEQAAFPLYTSISFDLTITSIFTPLVTGNAIALYGEDEATLLIEKIVADNRVNVVKLTPSHLKIIRDCSVGTAGPGGGIKRFIVGGEDLERQLAEDIHAQFGGRVEIYNEYGPTEATVGCMIYRFQPGEQLPSVPIGTPIRNTQIYLLDQFMRPVPVGVDGEMYIAGEGLAGGYLGQQALTRQRFVDNPFVAGQRMYKTGDLAARLPGGDLVFKGRIDDQVKIRGNRIELGEIAEQLTTHEQVKEAVVVAREQSGDKYLAAYYVAGQELAATELKACLLRKLPAYMVPAYFVRLEVLPVNANGKLDKKRLPEPTRSLHAGYVAPAGEVEEKVTQVWSEVLGHGKISTDRNFFDVGGDSLKLISVSNKLKKAFGRPVTVTDLFNYPTIAALAAFIRTESTPAGQPATETGPSQAPVPAGNAATDIAIIGMAGRFPGAVTVAQFWENLRAGRESITRKDTATPGMVGAKGVLAEYEWFDAAFFDYTPAEAESMDPQIRIFHECTWEALEDAGYPPNRYPGRIGLYGGASPNPYYNPGVSRKGGDDWTEAWEALTYADKDFLCPRVSYKLNLRGPSVNVVTACSTSLVAVDTACNELLAGKCDIAVAGGVSVTLHDNEGYFYRKGMILSPDGACRAFDAQSAGTVGGNGVGLVVLKKLADALRDGDLIQAVIKGTATNNDGSQKVGFAAPSVEGQARVIAAAIGRAGIAADTLSYVEAHGTGTALGDPVEIAGLGRAFRTDQKQFCAIGSVKTNIGHLDAAAGVAGLIKTVLALRHKQLPPSLHFTRPNAGIDFDNSPFYVNTVLKHWENGKYPRRAGVSSFGIGGTNAHVILEEAPVREPASAAREYQLLVVSAKTPAALRNNVANLARYLGDRPEAALADVAYTLQVGREPFAYRKMIVARSRREAIERLEAGADEKTDRVTPGQKQPVVFMFSGQGSQYVNMYAGLYNTEAVFRETADACFETVKQIAALDVKSAIFGAGPAGCLDQTRYTQPALFIVEYALARLLMHWGVQPSTMIGHSVGEYVAACLSGVFSLRDALTLVVKRGELMQEVAPGAMLSIAIAADTLRPLLAGQAQLSLAAVNSSERCVVSGPHEAVAAFADLMTAQGYQHRQLRTSHAFHSAMMDPVLDRFARVVAGVGIKAPQLPFISNLTGKEASAAEVISPQYWVSHLRQEVQFARGLETVLKPEGAVLLEVGPGNALATFARSHARRTGQHKVINLVRHPGQEGDDVQHLLQGMGNLWLGGVQPDWSGLYENERRTKVDLPTYAFDKVRFATPAGSAQKALEAAEALPLSRQSDVSRWFYAPAWKATPAVPAPAPPAAGLTYLLFADHAGVSEGLAARLEAQQARCLFVSRGEAYRELPGNRYELNPEAEEDYRQLWDRLAAGGLSPRAIVFAWGITGVGESALPDPRSLRECCPAFYALRHLVKAAHAAGCLAGTHITLLTGDLQNVTGSEPTAAGASALVALPKIIAQEYQAVSASHIDVSLRETGRQDFSRRLHEELQRQANGTVVALRHARRWEQHFEPVLYGRPAAGGIRAGGVYLITGGLDVLGFTLADYLLRTYGAKVVLLGEAELPTGAAYAGDPAETPDGDGTALKISRLERLAAAGGESVYLPWDNSPSGLAAVVQRAEARFGPLSGVIHAARILDGKSINIISKLDEADYEKQFGTKVTALHALHTVLGDRELDFCLVASSIASFLGAIRFGAYATANVVMDYYVNCLVENGGAPHWVSVNFDAVAYDDAGSEGIKTAELYEVFEQTVALRFLPQVVVSVADLPRRLQEVVAKKGSTHGTGAGNDALAAGSVPAGRRSADGTTAELLLLWRAFFGKDDIGPGDDFFELGGDSLKALTMIGRIHKRFNVELSVAEFFGNSQLAQLGAYLAAAGKKEAPAEVPRKGFAALRPAGPQADYPLSPVQRRLYFLHQFDQQSVAYNMPLTLALRGHLDEARFTAAFRSLIGRHENLRTYFEYVDDEPRQKVLGQFDFAIEHHLAGDNEAGIIRNFIRPFDLGVAPLLRVGLIRVAADAHILMVDMHHIITDGVSKGVFIRDFLALYNGEALPALTLQYKDYAEWLQSPQQRALRDGQRDFWLRELAEAPPVLELPADFTRPPVKDYAGDSLKVTIGPRETGALKAVAEREGATMFMALLSVYAILLGKLSNQEDLVVGTITAGRGHADLERMMGMFVNTLPLRVQPHGELTFRALLAAVKAKTLACFGHQEYSYDDLLDDLKLERDVSRNPLFDVMFAYQNFEEAEIRIPGLALRPYDDGYRVAKFDLTLHAIEQDGQIHLEFEYATGLFKRETVERFAGYFQRIVTAAGREAEGRLRQMDLLSDGEKQQLLYGFNNTEASYPREETLVSLFAAQVQKTPHLPAVSCGETTLTYHQLDEQSDRIAAYLSQSLGLVAGDLAGVMLEREQYLLPVIWAVLKAGAAYVPIDPHYPQARVHTIARDAGLKVLITRGAYGPGALDCPVADLEQVLPRMLACPPAAPVGVKGTDLAYVIYTSGSTGKPKGVMIEHHSVVNRLLWMQKHYPLTEADVLLQKTPLVFDVSVWELFWWSFTGASLRLLQAGGEKEPAAIIEAVKTHRVTTIHFVPSMLGAFLSVLSEDFDYSALSSLRQVFASGEALKPEQVNLLASTLHRHCGTALINLYGPTEATVDASCYPCTFGQETVRVPIGKPIDNIRLYVLDKDNRLVPVGVPGELCIGGVGLARGYLGNGPLTAEKFIPCPFVPGQRIYRTGDLARWLPDGNVEYLGRLDHQVKLRGYRIELGEIESQLANHEGIRETAVAIKQKAGDPYLVAYYLAERPLERGALSTFLAGRLPGYMVPDYFVHLPVLPVNGNGKLDRKALPEPAVEAGAGYVPPANQTEQKLVELWAQVLNLDQTVISVNKSFFELGGHSLKATLLANKIRQAFQVEVPLREIFIKKDVESQADYLITVKQIASGIEDSNTIEITI